MGGAQFMEEAGVELGELHRGQDTEVLFHPRIRGFMHLRDMIQFVLYKDHVWIQGTGGAV